MLFCFFNSTCKYRANLPEQLLNLKPWLHRVSSMVVLEQPGRGWLGKYTFSLPCFCLMQHGFRGTFLPGWPWRHCGSGVAAAGALKCCLEQGCGGGRSLCLCWVQQLHLQNTSGHAWDPLVPRVDEQGLKMMEDTGVDIL